MTLSSEDIGGQFRHKKSGNLYMLIGFGRLEKDESVQAIYRQWYGAGIPDIWIRPVKEFASKFDKVPMEGQRLTEQILRRSEKPQTNRE